MDVKDYHLDEYVGCGKIGFVYKGHLKSLPDCEHAVKLIRGQPRDGWDTELRKVTRLAKVQNVVPFHAVDTCQITKDGHTAIFQFTVWRFYSAR